MAISIISKKAYTKNKLYALGQGSYTPPPTSGTGFGLFGDGTRNKYLFPFTQGSIWNTPIGSGATLSPSGIAWGNYSYGFQTRFIAEEELIFMDPATNNCIIEYSSAEWTGVNRCNTTGSGSGFPVTVKMPNSYVVPHSGENNCTAWIDSTGDIVIQAQPLARCTAGTNGTAYVRFSDINIKTGDGALGAHGGSNLSALGGTIRFGEFSDAIVNSRTYFRHALKCNMHALLWYYWGGGGGNQYRSPATKADRYASASTYGGTNSQLKPGSLLTLSSSFDTNTLLDPYARIIWETIKRFGIYVVDDTTWNAFSMSMERGPAGNVIDEFATLAGFSFEQQPNNSSQEINFYKDMRTGFNNTYVVTNNSLGNPGGGGSPLYSTPLAPAFGN